LQERSLATTSGEVGGYLVPTGVSSQVIQDVAALESIRRGAQGAPGASVLPLEGPTNVPLINDATADYYSEAGTSSGIADTAPTFSNVELRPQLLIARVPVKWHLLNRSVADLQQELVRSFTRGIAKAENSKFFVGTGTNEPEGLTTVSPTVTAAAVDVFTAAEIDEVFYSMPTEFVNQSVWIVSPEAAAIIRSLETSQGVPLYSQDRSDGLTRVHGRPLIVDSYMPSVEAAAVPVVLADLSQAYVIGEETGLTVLADPYSRSSFAETVINVFKFNDGRIRKASAVKSLKMASD
jgi:HK97 family phage major capsid protein